MGAERPLPQRVGGKPHHLLDGCARARALSLRRIYRSRDRGDNWEALANGLSQVNAYQNALRQAMSTDSLDSAGIYVGTQGGQLLLSRDSGDHWELIFNWLPPISSVECVSFTS